MDRNLITYRAHIDAPIDRWRARHRQAQSARSRPRAAAGLAGIVGEFRHQVPTRYEGHEFSLGTPYPDRDEHPAGGILFIDEATFQNATLRTYDGNDYFSISITTQSIEILIQDVDSGLPLRSAGG
jgi:hypothetical protein